MLKPFDELYQLDVSQKIKKKPTFKYNKATKNFEETGKTLDYLSWVDVLVLLHENGAESVRYGNIVNQEGHSLFLCGGALPEVHVFVEIDQTRYEMTYPVIDGSTDIKMEKIVQSDIHNASQRAFVKCVAVNTGLGLSLWQKEELGKGDKPEPLDPSIHNIFVVKKRIEEQITAKIQRGMEYRDILSSIGLNEKQLKTIMGYFETINKLEQKLVNL